MTLKAGDIIFGLKADDTELKAALGTVKQSFANVSKAVGVAMTAAGAAITGFATKSIVDFAKAGDEVQKMADRTGFSTERLSELRHAAELSGTSLQGIEKASRNLSRVIHEAGQGTATYTDALAAVGLSYEQLAGLGPEQQFNMVALALADVQDKTTQVALATELFGARAGTALLPMLANGSAGLAEMAAEAHRLGIVFDQEGANKAAEFNDAMQRLGESFDSFKYDVASELIPVLIDLMNWVQGALVSFREWRDANPGLTSTIIKFTAAAGAITTVVGPILVVLPGLVTAFAAVKAAVVAFVAALGTIAAAVSAPVAVVVAAIAAIVAAGVALVYYWDEVKTALKAAWQFIADAWWTVWGPIIEAIKWLANTGLGLLDRVGGFFGSRGNGALNPDALDRYNNRQPRTSNSTGFGDGTGGGGLGGGVNINNMTVVTNNPELASRDIAENLYANLRAAGVTL